MARLATAAELRSFLDQTADELPDPRAELLLDLVSGSVEAYATEIAGRRFTVTDDETIRVDGSGTSILLLPGLPVTDVAAVIQDPDDTNETLAVGDWEWSPDGILRRLNGRWVRRFRYYAVTYSHGYDTVPDGVKLVVLRVAARATVNPEGLTQESAGGWAGGYGVDDSRFAGLTAIDLRELDRALQ